MKEEEKLRKLRERKKIN